MRFASLGSGSRGNGTVAAVGTTVLLVDLGFPLAESERRLAALGLAPESVSAILVTHEHGDHVGGVGAFARRHGTPVWLTAGTAEAAAATLTALPEVHVFDAERPFVVRDFEVRPYVVPHDAREPVQYVLGDGRSRLGILTDAGSITPHVRRALDGCDGLVLEFNHDAALLAASDYPAFLKARISGPFGHLGNAVAAGLLAGIDTRRLQHFVAAHLSERNNRPDLVTAAAAAALGCSPDWIAIAGQDGGLDWRSLAA